MFEKVAIVGAGAVGGYVGAQLSRAGVETVFIDPWPEHVEAVRSKGIDIREMNPAENFTAKVRALHICDVPQLIAEKPFDVVFVAVKSYDTRWATQMIAPYVAPGGCFVSLQNSINEEEMAAIVGWGRTLGCTVNLLAAELIEPGVVVRNSPRGTDKSIGLCVGEVHGRVTPRVQALVKMLEHADTTKATTNLWGDRWSKLVINAMRNGVSAVTGMSGKQRDLDDHARDVTIRLGSSCVRVGKTMGLELDAVSGLDLDVLARAEEDPEAYKAITEMIFKVAHSRSDGQRPSMGQDIRKGRRTETHAINGLVAERGRQFGVDASIHQRLHEIILQVEAGKLTPSPDLIRDL